MQQIDDLRSPFTWPPWVRHPLSGKSRRSKAAHRAAGATGARFNYNIWAKAISTPYTGGLVGKLDDVREAAAAGSREPIQQFVAGLHEQLALEHRQWLGVAESTQASLAKIRRSIGQRTGKTLKGHHRD